MFRKFILLITFVLLTFINSSLAGVKAGSINLGRNIARGDGSEYWDNGFSLGGNVFWSMNPHLLYGFRMAYSSRNYNKFSGNINIFEVVPSVRIVSTSKDALNIFGHFGLGYHRRQFGAQQTLYSGYWSASDTRNSLGFSLGGGLLIGKSNKICLEIFPLFSFLAHNNQFFNNYFTINIGIFSRGK